jgi:hypothetical protein
MPEDERCCFARPIGDFMLRPDSRCSWPLLWGQGKRCCATSAEVNKRAPAVSYCEPPFIPAHGIYSQTSSPHTKLSRIAVDNAYIDLTTAQPATWAFRMSPSPLKAASQPDHARAY